MTRDAKDISEIIYRPVGRHRWWIPAVAAVAGLAVTFTVWQALLARDRQIQREAFEAEARVQAQVTADAFAEVKGAGAALSAYFAGSELVEHHEWNAFALPLLWQKPSLLSVQWAPRVWEEAGPPAPENRLPRPHYPMPSADHATVTEAETGEAHPIVAFDPDRERLVPVAEPGEHHPLSYQATTDGQAWQFGFDWASEPVAQKAMQRAVASGEPALAGPLPRAVRQAVTGDVEDVLVVFTPIFFKAGIIEPIDTVEQRRARLKGFVVVGFHLRELVAAGREHLPRRGIDLHIFDASAEDEPALLHFASSRLRDRPIEPYLAPDDGVDRLHAAEQFELAGRTWHVHATATDQYRRKPTGKAPTIALGSGLLLSVLLTAYLASTANRAALIRREVIERTAALSEANESLQREIFARERAQQAIRQKESRFRTLAETATDAIVLADQQGRITYLNPAAEQMFGYAAAEALQQPLTILMPERFRELHREGFARYLTTREPRLIGRTVEIAGRHKSGREFPIEISLAAQDEDGALTFTGILRDITARKHAEARIQEAALSLRRSNEDLEQFAYVASHDLKEPLRKIEGFGRMLEDQLGSALHDEGRDSLERMRAATHRMRELIDGLLAYSRVTTKTRPFEVVDLNDVVRQVLTDLELRLEETGGHVQVDPLPAVYADPLQMRQLLQNLISNALKFHKPQQPPRVRVYAEQVPGHASDTGQCEYHLCVADNGIGVDPRDVRRLFQPFQRVHGEYEGTGIGLAVCRRIAERHGGTIEVHSTPEEGTTFIVILPHQPHEHPRQEVTAS